LRDKNALFDSMMNVELSRSIARAVVIDAEEDFERKSTSLAGYAEAMDRIGQALCAATGYPATLLFGKSPDGQNATGASDVRLFYDYAATGQTSRVAPPLMRLVEIELACAGEDPEAINHSVKFHSLWQPTQLETLQTRKLQAEIDNIYVPLEVYSSDETGVARFGGDDFSYETPLDFEARHAQEAAMLSVNPKPNSNDTFVSARIIDSTLSDATDPKFKVGDKVIATVNHMTGMKGSTGVIAIANAGAPPYYGVKFNGEIHRWLSEDEIVES
jgi:hypothetical protein